MQKTFINITTILILIITFLLGQYFDVLYQNEKLTSFNLHIYPADKNFIEAKEIQKLIKINNLNLKNINIKTLENKLEQNDYINNAEVYKNLNGKVIAEINQYHPIARVLGKTSYYIDITGDKKPLSNHYTEHVVLVFGEITKENKNNIIQLIQTINNDKILKNIISEIHIKNKYLSIKTDKLSSNIKINIKDFNNQLYKLKIIYNYLIKKNLENKYPQIDLQYEKQAICKY